MKFDKLIADDDIPTNPTIDDNDANEIEVRILHHFTVWKYEKFPATQIIHDVTYYLTIFSL